MALSHKLLSARRLLNGKSNLSEIAVFFSSRLQLPLGFNLRILHPTRLSQIILNLTTVKRDEQLSDRCPEIAARRRRRRESAVEDQGTDSCPQCADAGKPRCGVLKFYVARDKARCFA